MDDEEGETNNCFMQFKAEFSIGIVRHHQGKMPNRWSLILKIAVLQSIILLCACYFCSIFEMRRFLHRLKIAKIVYFVTIYLNFRFSTFSSWVLVFFRSLISIRIPKMKDNNGIVCLKCILNSRMLFFVIYYDYREIFHFVETIYAC